MKIEIIAVGTRMPRWVSDGYAEFIQRFNKDLPVQLKEIEPAARRKSANANQYKTEEAQRIKQQLPKNATMIALEVTGESWTTEQLSKQMSDWMMQGNDVALIVGGPDGLDAELLSQCQKKWSLSRLTFPHALVRVILAEQLYRAWSILKNHPYHRV